MYGRSTFIFADEDKNIIFIINSYSEVIARKMLLKLVPDSKQYDLKLVKEHTEYEVTQIKITK